VLPSFLFLEGDPPIVGLWPEAWTGNAAVWSPPRNRGCATRGEFVLTILRPTSREGIKRSHPSKRRAGI